MIDDTSTPPTPIAMAAATFLSQALGLGDAPASIASELTEVKVEPHAAIYSVELDSSIGSAAFLIYAFVLTETDDDGSTGADRYREGRDALQTAAERDTPGPRMVAHAESDALAFILATTPATWLALHGDGGPRLEATGADLPTTAMSLDQRSSLAEDLHRSLRDASEHARQWMTAIRAVDNDPRTAAFTEAETALALFVLDDDNVQPLLAALNTLVTAAQSQASEAAGSNRAGTSGTGDS